MYKLNKLNNMKRCPKPLTDNLMFVVLELPKFIKKFNEVREHYLMAVGLAPLSGKVSFRNFVHIFSHQLASPPLNSF